MSQAALFPDPYYHGTPEDPNRKLGTAARRTIRQRANLDGGLHPATKLRLLNDDWGYTCGDCALLWLKRERSFRGWKCAKARRLTAKRKLDGPDMRKWWPACTAFRIKADR